ncbi:LuxR C-terminal-related transcriptional regulator [Micromonospora soli]|uniref:LuxR C-terminal-related transcriptional regulator n=1 Tax=Micromonospora sp. NBRC 110009 TaxID=3061627 RepID=UPI002671CF85|nr:LuxR family transcriptional regulator [Micromonospora sp. NBRC 110009]WKT97742.1 LuxR C-terminal-related transcriptional regulator [Micromonospora sp. NBRC 110009]
MEAGWPFIGRTRERDRAVEALTAASGAGVLLTGDPGVGKSRLLDEVLDQALRRQRVTLRVTATPGWQAVPFGVLANRFPQAADANVADVFRDVERRLREVAAGRAVVVGVDDLNWLDDASAALLERLVAGGAVQVVASVRSDCLDAAPVAALRRSRSVDRIHVPPLDAEETTDVIRAALGGPVDGLTLDALWRISQGNPLFLREALRCGLRDGGLVRRDGMWTWPAESLCPTHLADLIQQTLGTLAPDEVEAMRYVAHAEPVPLAVLDRVVEPRTAEQLEERGLIRLLRHDSAVLVQTGHPLYAEAVRNHTGELRARRLRRNLADALAELGGGGADDLARVVAWRCEADLPVAAADLLTASEYALRRHDPVLAERLGRQIGSARGDWQVARALLAQGRGDEADAHLRRAAAELTDPRDRAEATALRALHAFWGERRPEEARAVLDAGRRDLPAEAHPGLLAAEVGIAVFGGDLDGARDSMARLAADRPRDPLLATAVAALQPYLLLFDGQPGRAARMFDSGEVDIPETWPTMRAAAQACHVQSLLMSGRLAEASRLAKRYYRDALGRRAADAVGLLAFARGKCAYHAGQLRRSIRWLHEARTLVGERALFPIRDYVLSANAYVAAQLGEPAEGKRLLEHLRGDEEADRGAAGGLVATDAELTAAWLAAVDGQLATAVGRLHELHRRAAQATTITVECLHLLSRLAPSAETADRLTEAAAGCDSPLFDLWAAHARALAADDPAGLERVSTSLEASGYLTLALETVIAAEAACERRGEHRRANLLARRADLLREQCGGYWPPLNPRSDSRDELTPRERQICELAAAGRDNATIAAELVLSVRTVENHLQRAYVKLGLRSRSGLAQALGTQRAG